MPEKQYPRRRDVRAMLDQLCAGLNERYDGDRGDFDRSFLNDVRDIMRDGFDFMGAVGIALDDGDDEAQAAIETAVADAFDFVN